MSDNRGTKLRFGRENGDRTAHFFQTNTPVLEGIFAIIHVIVVVIGVGEEVVLGGKHKAGGQVLEG